LVMRMYCGKTAGPIEMPFGMWGGVGRSNHVLDRRPDPPGEEAILAWERGRPIVKYREYARRDTCHPLAKDAEACVSPQSAHPTVNFSYR